MGKGGAIVLFLRKTLSAAVRVPRPRDHMIDIKNVSLTASLTFGKLLASALWF